VVGPLALGQAVDDGRLQSRGPADVIEFASQGLGSRGFGSAAPQGPSQHPAGSAGSSVLVFVAGRLDVFSQARL
jgi:hypothetical protein